MDESPSDQDSALLTRLNALKKLSVSLDPNEYGISLSSSSVVLGV